MPNQKNRPPKTISEPKNKATAPANSTATSTHSCSPHTKPHSTSKTKNSFTKTTTTRCSTTRVFNNAVFNNAVFNNAVFGDAEHVPDLTTGQRGAHALMNLVVKGAARPDGSQPEPLITPNPSSPQTPHHRGRQPTRHRRHQHRLRRTIRLAPSRPHPPPQPRRTHPLTQRQNEMWLSRGPRQLGRRRRVMTFSLA